MSRPPSTGRPPEAGPTPEVRVVAAWHEALNEGDVERVVELSHPEVEVGGPRGGGRGRRLLREWVERAGIRLDPLRTFHGAQTVVVEQGASWRSPETGELSGTQVAASVFVVRDGKVASVSRHPDLADALRAAGLDESRVSGAAGRLHIRSYRPEDKEAVWRLHNEALDEVGAHLGNGEWDADLHEIQVSYLQAGGEFLVGVLDGRVAAMGALKRISTREAEVKRMRVEPALQGRGYGWAILDALHRRAAELGYSRLYLETTAHQRAARSLYEQNGYRESRRGKVGPFDCVFYERNVVV